MSGTSDRTNSLGRKVLCIDDDLHVLDLERAILETAGCKVLLANSGEEGINIAKNHAMDIVVVDSEMPRVSGTQVAQSLRIMRPKLPIIMVSGGNLPDEAAMIVDCFVPKTTMVTHLVQEVYRLTNCPKICPLCGLPIEQEQRPSVALADGKEVHVECYSKTV